MSIARSVGYLAAGTAASVTAVEFGVALEIVKHIGTVCGAVVALVSVVKLGRNWASAHVRAAVAEEIEGRFQLLACVKTRGLLCDKDGEQVEGE